MERAVLTHTMATIDTRDIKESYHKAAELVAAWGRSVLPDGRTVEQALTIEGISLWSAVSSMLAFDHISRVMPHASRQDVSKKRWTAFVQKATRIAFDAAVPIISGKSGCIRWPDRPVFLFLGFTRQMYRETLQPVAANLARRADSPVVILDDLYPYQARAGARGGEFHSLWQHWGDDAARTKHRFRKVLKAASAYLLKDACLPEIVSRSGMAWSTVHPIFEWLFDTCLPRQITNAALALHIIERHRPALVISPDVNDPRTRIFCLAGRLAGIRTLEIQFTFYGINNIEWRFFLADHLAVTGDANLRVMLDHGIPPEKMTVTGSPRYDNALTWPDDLTLKIRSELKIPAGKVMVLFASQPYYYGTFSSPAIRREMIQALFHAAAEHDNLVLVVKPHPLEDPAELSSLAPGAGNILFADKMLDIRELIKASDAFVTSYSSTTFDSLVMNKPTINLLFPGCCANNLFEQCGATFVARTGDDIARILRLLSSGRSSVLPGDLSDARERFLRDWFHRLDGRAAERIAAIALEMSAGSANH